MNLIHFYSQAYDALRLSDALSDVEVHHMFESKSESGLTVTYVHIS